MKANKSLSGSAPVKFKSGGNNEKSGRQNVYLASAYINHLQQIIGEQAVNRMIESGQLEDFKE